MPALPCAPTPSSMALEALDCPSALPLIPLRKGFFSERKTYMGLVPFLVSG